MGELSWTPVRRGTRYCSPACGLGCTTVEFDRAGVEAARLVEILGPKWTPVVWENLGWYYRAEIRGEDGESIVELYPHTNRNTSPPQITGYWAKFDPWTADGDTPDDALAALAAEVRAVFERISEAQKRLVSTLPEVAST